ncbi:hypothetical protein ABZP36_023052 [Zizania latifolia]
MASVLPLLLLLLCSYHSLVAHAGDGQSYRVLSLNPKAVCSEPNAIPSSSGGTTVPLNHRHGPCSPVQSEKKMTDEELLRRDQLRADHIQRKFSKNAGADDIQQSKVTVPTTLGSSLNTLQYVISVGIGSPAVTQTMTIDTGSDVSWVQCKPCPNPPCHAQTGSLFDPTASCTYAPFSCSAAECTQLAQQGNGCNSNSQCQYIVVYGDGSSTNGTYSSDTLTLSKQVPTFYGATLQDIVVGGKKLGLSPSVFSAGSVVDSGTIITRLPPTAYSALSSAFKDGMKQYPPAQPRSILDTCFDFTGQDEISIPTVALVFSGGAVVDLDANGIMFGSCLAFAATDDDGTTGIIGNVQQRTFEVLYDVGSSVLGFRSGAC